MKKHIEFKKGEELGEEFMTLQLGDIVTKELIAKLAEWIEIYRQQTYNQAVKDCIEVLENMRGDGTDLMIGGTSRSPMFNPPGGAVHFKVAEPETPRDIQALQQLLTNEE